MTNERYTNREENTPEIRNRALYANRMGSSLLFFLNGRTDPFVRTHSKYSADPLEQNIPGAEKKPMSTRTMDVLLHDSKE